ncbi:MAG TPA: reverse transcriptase domain-containing protein [Polyangiaceae bacterium]
MIPRLDDPDLYAAILARLAKRWAARGRIDSLSIDGLTLADLRCRRQQLAKLLAKTVVAGAYRFSALTACEALIDGKPRTLYRANLLDRVVQTAVARYLAAVSEAQLLPVLHSYRKGRSPFTAIESLIRYLRRHRSDVPLEQRGIFVLRLDIKRYGENIDTGRSSPLWSLIDNVLESDSDARHRRIARDMLSATIRQPIDGQDGTSQPLARGIPTGSPIQTPCANLYLLPVDAYCSSIEGAFYARFGDDILFGHADLAVVSRVSRELEARLIDLGLTVNAEKRVKLDFNGAGRRRTSDAAFRPCQRLTYLGASIDFHGYVTLKPEKLRDLVRSLRERVRQASRMLAGADADERADALCEMLQSALSPSDINAVPMAEFLHSRASCRAELRDLDFRIALLVAEALTGRRGPRAFRKLSYRALRQRGLPSLAMARDRHRTVRVQSS